MASFMNVINITSASVEHIGVTAFGRSEVIEPYPFGVFFGGGVLMDNHALIVHTDVKAKFFTDRNQVMDPTAVAITQVTLANGIRLNVAVNDRAAVGKGHLGRRFGAASGPLGTAHIMGPSTPHT